MPTGDSKDRALAEYARVLKPGGVLLTQDVCFRCGDTAEQKVGAMTLMDPEGMIHDEGVEGALKIMFNAMKQENHEMFSNMFRFFNSHKDELGYVANFRTKPLAGAAAA